MMNNSIIVEIIIPRLDVDEAFEWWMQRYQERPDGQFYDIAKQLKPYVSVQTYDSWHREFEHPKGETVVTISLGKKESREGLCKKHSQPIAWGYCE